jgi:hypothetical protein
MSYPEQLFGINQGQWCFDIISSYFFFAFLSSISRRGRRSSHRTHVPRYITRRTPLLTLLSIASQPARPPVAKLTHGPLTKGQITQRFLSEGVMETFLTKMFI